MEKQKHDDRGIAHFLVIFSIIVCCLLVAMVAWVRISDIQAANKRHAQAVIERKKFQNYSALIERLGKQIIATTSPTESKQIEYCDRTNVKYGEGELSCSVEIFFHFAGLQREDAARKDDQIADVLKQKSNYFKLSEDDGTWINQKIGGAKFNKKCLYEMQWHQDSHFLDPYYPFKDNTGAIAYLSCSDSAVEPYFKVIDY